MTNRKVELTTGGKTLAEAKIERGINYEDFAIYYL